MTRVPAAFLTAVVLLATAACGIQPTWIIGAGSKPVSGYRPEPVTIYLVKSDRLVPVRRPGLPGHPFLGVLQLGVPITSEERRAGLSTAIPRDVRLLLMEFDGESPDEISVITPEETGSTGELVVDAGRRGRWPRLALGQLACTAEAIRGVRRTLLVTDPAADTTKAVGTRPGDLRLRCADYADLR
ncbi:hypothetical protein GCM10009678_44710 [Actinomadura kijaniata]|uniref:GerMN domain-containing protein n=1 Tax=Actinomadura namibiensis TaxID=182080 RepID=A0A7W3QQJ6_ACTNM|nr:hypothetical protein [Actinomadura namibiensis]MBA8955780.1 hypothetical protein [Actinomadura namibiensis]